MDEGFFMKRCFELARAAGSAVLPNPQVGAVLVAGGRIIGEGFHRMYGQAHAEVNAVASVQPEDRPLIREATLYVSLEPCSIYGKTPPCTDLILREGIRRVVISCIDRTPGVDGAGVARLRAAGVEVAAGLLREEGEQLAATRNTFVSMERPYILLKYAVDRQGLAAAAGGRQVWITNPVSRRLVHKWRSETGAILVGSRTAALDDPALTVRYGFNRQPVRITIDRRLRLPRYLQLFDGSAPTLVYTTHTGPAPEYPETTFVRAPAEAPLLDFILEDLYRRKISHLTVEGGPALLSRFLDAGCWDEARVFTGETDLKSGIPGPILPAEASRVLNVGGDILRIYRRETPFS